MAQASVGTGSAATVYTNVGARTTWVVLHNKGANSVFIGDPSTAVTTGNGYELATSEISPAIPVPPGGVITAIAGTGTNRLDVLAVGG